MAHLPRFSPGVYIPKKRSGWTP